MSTRTVFFIVESQSNVFNFYAILNCLYFDIDETQSIYFGIILLNMLDGCFVCFD